MHDICKGKNDQRTDSDEWRMQTLRERQAIDHERDNSTAQKPHDAAKDGIAQERDQRVRPALVADQQNFDQQQRKKDGEWVVRARFHFEHGADARAQPQAAGIDQEKHRGRVGRRHNGADQQSLDPVEPKDVFGDRRRQNCGNEHANRCERHRRRQNIAEGRKACAQSAIEQNKGQRDRADGIGDADVIELDAARSVLASQHANQKEDQQQRRPEAHRDQARQDAGEHQQAAEQYDEAYAVERTHRANLLLL